MLLVLTCAMVLTFVNKWYDMDLACIMVISRFVELTHFMVLAHVMVSVRVMVLACVMVLSRR